MVKMASWRFIRRKSAQHNYCCNIQNTLKHGVTRHCLSGSKLVLGQELVNRRLHLAFGLVRDLSLLLDGVEEALMAALHEVQPEGLEPVDLLLGDLIQVP